MHDEVAVEQSGPTAVRRPLKSRDTAWARVCAGWLARHRVRPNAISFLSSVFAAIAGASLALAGHVSDVQRILLLVAAVAGIQFRLLCNLMDGMVAIEGGRKSRTGEIWNDVPDRISDVLIFVGAGYGLAFWWGPALGWLAATLAVMTAYVRLLAGTVGAKQRFLGPMAKQHRMAVMTVACGLSIVESLFVPRGAVLAIALAVISVGAIVTLGRRLLWIRRDLQP
jgi:phosphatidylglycerophosphate synthase